MKGSIDSTQKPVCDGDRSNSFTKICLTNFSDASRPGSALNAAGSRTGLEAMIERAQTINRGKRAIAWVVPVLVAVLVVHTGPKACLLTALVCIARLCFIGNGLRLWGHIAYCIWAHGEGSYQLHLAGSYCGKDQPISNAIWSQIESLMKETHLPVDPEPVPEIWADTELEWSMREAHVCEALKHKSDGWARPVVIRGLLPDSPTIRFWESVGRDYATLLEDLLVTFRDYSEISQHWKEIRDCPARRKKPDLVLALRFPLAMALLNDSVLSGEDQGDPTSVYVAFESRLMQELDERLGGRLSAAIWEHRLQNLCGIFGGYGSEVFMGRGPLVGSILHSAMMPNLFLQTTGTRMWTLISPKYSQMLRPFQSLGYSIAPHPVTDWGTLSRTDTFARIPRLQTEIRRGDVILAPAWWWHEIRNPNNGTTIGFSNRGAPEAFDWRAYPVLRAMLNFDTATDVLTFDVSNTIWTHLAGAPYAPRGAQRSSFNRRVN